MMGLDSVLLVVPASVGLEESAVVFNESYC